MGIKQVAQAGKTFDQVMSYLRYATGSRIDYARYELHGVTGFLRHIETVQGGRAVVEHVGLGDIHGGIKFSMLNIPVTLRAYDQTILRDKPIWYYRLASGAGNPVSDISGHGLNGAINGAVSAIRTTLLRGKQDQADFSFYFPGSASAFVNVPTNSAFNLTNKFSLEAIIRPDGVQAGSVYNRAGAYELGLDAQGHVFFTGTFSDNSTLTITSESVLSKGEDYHLRVQSDGTAIRIFVDYGLVAQALSVKIIKTVSAPLRIGENFLGYIDEAAGYAYGLTELQGRMHYQTAFADSREVFFGFDEIKPVFCSVMPDGTKLEFPMGVYVMTTPDIDVQQSEPNIDVVGYDRTLYLIDDTFTSRYLLPKNDRITDHIVSIIKSTGLQAVSIQPSDEIADRNLEFFIGSTKKKAVNELLARIGYFAVTADENGVLTSSKYSDPAARPVDVEYKTNEFSVLTPKRSLRRDFFKVPNQAIGYTGTLEETSLTSVARNTNIKSDVSIPNRRRTISSVYQIEANSQEILDGLVKAKLDSASNKNIEYDAETLPMPYHTHLNKIRIYDGKLLGEGKYQDFIQTRWSIVLGGQTGNSGGMVHELRKSEEL